MKVPESDEQDINHQSPNSVGGRYKQVKDSFYLDYSHEFQPIV